MKHIFIAIGQTHLNNFELLLNNKLVPKKDAILVLDTNIIYDKTLWKTVIKAPESFNNNSSSRIQRISAISNKVKSYASIIKKLKPYKDEKSRIYLSYIEDILSNYMFFSFSKNAEIVVVEDGTLNYYNHTLADINPLKFRVKKIISQIIGVPFKRYKGHSSGANYDTVVEQYLTFPKQAIIQKNIKQLPVEKTPINNTINALYIVGQEGSCNLIGLEPFTKALDGFFKCLVNEPFYKTIDTIHYKPHRNGVRLEQSFLQNYFPDKKLHLVSTTKTAEDLFFEDLPCRYISSFSSSTLINIYSRLRREDLSKINFSVYPLESNELLHLFKKLNFNFIKAPKNN